MTVWGLGCSLVVGASSLEELLFSLYGEPLSLTIRRNQKLSWPFFPICSFRSVARRTFHVLFLFLPSNCYLYYIFFLFFNNQLPSLTYAAHYICWGHDVQHFVALRSQEVTRTAYYFLSRPPPVTEPCRQRNLMNNYAVFYGKGDGQSGRAVIWDFSTTLCSV